MSTPRPSTQKKQPLSGSQGTGKTQRSIMGFFQKASTNSPSPAPSTATPVPKKTPTSALSKSAFTRPQLPTALTPQPSSDPAAPEPSSPIRKVEESSAGKNKENGLLSPGMSSDAEANRGLPEVAGVAFSSPSRKVCSPLPRARSSADTSFRLGSL